MSANDRAPATLWYWKDHMTDPYVRAMTYDERGRYWDVLGITHQTEEPGVMTEEQVRCWAGYTEEEWPKHRAALGGAFKIQGDVWVQKRTVEDRRKQKRRFEQSQRGGRTSASRARDSLGRLEPRLGSEADGGMASGPSTPSFAFSSSMRRDPTPPPPAERPPAAAPAVEGGNGRGAHREHSPEALCDVLARAMPERGGGTAIPNGTGFADAVLAKQQRRFPDLDVFGVAMTVAADVRDGGVRDPVGLLVHRCKELRAEGERRRADEGRAAHSSSVRLQTPHNELEPRVIADFDDAPIAPNHEGHHEEE